jgi:hypothetical protein
MPYQIKQIEQTPNPRARKLIVEPAPGTIRSYFKAEDAKNDPLGTAIFRVPGITNVLIHTAFISVCIGSQADWKTVTKDLRSALAAAPES